MKFGFLLGKFLPLHAGHEHLIRTALDNCDLLTIMVCSLEREPIRGVVRHDWMEMIFPQARVVHVDEELPQYPEEDPENFWDIWRDVVKRNHPEDIDIVFSSEEYGDRLAQELGAVHFCVDQPRITFPVSGTKCRANPFEQWEYLSHIVRPYFTKGFLITGPESTGKSTLTERLAQHFNTIGVQEYARQWIDNHNGEWEFKDLDTFAQVQMDHIYWAKRRANKVFFTDTNQIATEIFSKAYFDMVSPNVRGKVRFHSKDNIDFAFLMDVDCPWVDDGQRDFPDQAVRQFMLSEHERYLKDLGIPYMTLSGSWDEKFNKAVAHVEHVLATTSY